MKGLSSSLSTQTSLSKTNLRVMKPTKAEGGWAGDVPHAAWVPLTSNMYRTGQSGLT